MSRRPAVAGLAAAIATVLLTGCTLVTTLASPPASPTAPTAPGVTWSGDDTPPPVPTTTSAPSETPPPFVDQAPVPVELGVPATIEGRAGNQVGTITFDDVVFGFEDCTKPDYAAPDNTQIVEIAFTVVADAALAAEDDSYDYPRMFEMYLANLRTPGGQYLSDSLGFDCVGIGEWIDDVEPGETLTGSIYLEVETLPAYQITWDYGHQRFTLDAAV